MTNQQLAIASLAMDLKRIALSLHRGSGTVASRFTQEALLRKSEIKLTDVPPYIAKVLSQISSSLDNLSADRTPEDLIMYSTLCQNYVTAQS